MAFGLSYSSVYSFFVRFFIAFPFLFLTPPYKSLHAPCQASLPLTPCFSSCAYSATLSTLAKSATQGDSLGKVFCSAWDILPISPSPLPPPLPASAPRPCLSRAIRDRGEGGLSSDTFLGTH